MPQAVGEGAIGAPMNPPWSPGNATGARAPAARPVRAKWGASAAYRTPRRDRPSRACAGRQRVDVGQVVEVGWRSCRRIGRWRVAGRIRRGRLGSGRRLPGVTRSKPAWTMKCRPPGLGPVAVERLDDLLGWGTVLRGVGQQVATAAARARRGCGSGRDGGRRARARSPHRRWTRRRRPTRRGGRRGSR